uniref:AAA family ATPase L572 family n=1 Tax=Cajanus cajan TaxID=3821 RepID=A0A151RUH0_CAJCA|nr:Putative AAA family ATPase L572 family [Cajanus cajan]
MDPKKKQEIINGVAKFKTGKEYYAKVGNAWATMADFMNYDVYDLELTAVKENTELRKLLTETSSKGIIVIEGIDCSLDLTAQMKKGKEEGRVINKSSKVTLSGSLNFIDEIWSACGGERIIIFTTNYVEKLDPALIRRGIGGDRYEYMILADAAENCLKNLVESHEEAKKKAEKDEEARLR